MTRISSNASVVVLTTMISMTTMVLGMVVCLTRARLSALDCCCHDFCLLSVSHPSLVGRKGEAARIDTGIASCLSPPVQVRARILEEGSSEASSRGLAVSRSNPTSCSSKTSTPPQLLPQPRGPYSKPGAEALPRSPRPSCRGRRLWAALLWACPGRRAGVPVLHVHFASFCSLACLACLGFGLI